MHQGWHGGQVLRLSAARHSGRNRAPVKPGLSRSSSQKVLAWGFLAWAPVLLWMKWGWCPPSPLPPGSLVPLGEAMAMWVSLKAPHARPGRGSGQRVPRLHPWRLSVAQFPGSPPPSVVASGPQGTQLSPSLSGRFLQTPRPPHLRSVTGSSEHKQQASAVEVECETHATGAKEVWAAGFCAPASGQL